MRAKRPGANGNMGETTQGANGIRGETTRYLTNYVLLYILQAEFNRVPYTTKTENGTVLLQGVCI